MPATSTLGTYTYALTYTQRQTDRHTHTHTHTYIHTLARTHTLAVLGARMVYGPACNFDLDYTNFVYAYYDQKIFSNLFQKSTRVCLQNYSICFLVLGAKMMCGIT